MVHYLVKWKSLPYEDSTWELEEDVDPVAIEIFKKLNHPPTDEEIEVRILLYDSWPIVKSLLFEHMLSHVHVSYM